MFKKYISIVLLFMISSFCHAQNKESGKIKSDVFPEKCGAVHALEQQIKNNPEIEENRKEINTHINKVLQRKDSYKSKVKEVITIPVVFHIVYKTDAEKLSEERVRSQLDVLNEDFRMLNDNVDETLSIFKDRAADLEIEFCLAQRDPDGLPTSGIEYISTAVDTFYFDARQAIKFSDLGGTDVWSADEYLNIWVGDLEPGLLGYGQFPGMEKSTDGIAINYVQLGRVGTTAGITGRTATHEVGHWLDLQHIWGDGDCSMDDGIEDTPPADDWHSGCTPSSDSCTDDNEPDMVQNYMDYSDDTCLTLFTKGQKERVRAIFEPGGPREIILSSQACMPPNLKDDDTRLVEITNVKTNENLCATSFTPAIQFRNVGNNALSNLSIKTYIDENLIDTYNWTGNVATGDFAETNLNAIELPKGPHQIKIVITEVNTNADEKPEDNEISLNIQALGDNLPLAEGFEEDNFPPSYTNIIDVSEDNEGWELKTGIAHTGNNCMFINCFDYGLSGAVDEFVLPLIDLTNVGDPMLEFYNAYARYDSNDSDTLEILVSKDCGQNYTSVYKQEGVFIATVGNRQEYYEPASENEWKQRIVDLKAFEGESEVSVKFRCINSHEQNLYIDDIRIFGDSMIPVTEHELSNFNIYPNPVINELFVQFDTREKWNLSLRAVNGKIVLAEDEKPEKLNLEHLPSGIYFLEVQLGTNIYSRKIVKM